MCSTGSSCGQQGVKWASTLIFHITGIRDCLNAKRLLPIMHYLMPVIQLFISSSVEACPSLKVLFLTCYHYLLLSLLPWQWFSFTLTLYHKIYELFYLWCQTNLKLQGKLCNKCPSGNSSETAVIVTFSCAISGFTSNDRAPGGPVTRIYLVCAFRCHVKFTSVNVSTAAYVVTPVIFSRCEWLCEW